MKALFVLHDQIWAGYNVGWSKKELGWLGAQTISNYDLGESHAPFPQPQWQLWHTNQIVMWMLNFLLVLQFVTTSSHFLFFFHVCIFNNFRDFLKLETLFSIFSIFSPSPPLTFFFFFLLPSGEPQGQPKCLFRGIWLEVYWFSSHWSIVLWLFINTQTCI